MAELEEPRLVGIAGAHVGMEKKWILLWNVFLQVYIRANQVIAFSDEKWIPFSAELSSQLCTS